MERRSFLKKLSLLPLPLTFLVESCKKATVLSKTTCGDNITPPVPEGPFYIDEKLNRSNIIEDRIGVPLTLIFKVEDKNCNPIKDAIVDIWQCDKEGHYSDELAENTVGQKWLRGFQHTGTDGKCTFQTIFPGWYDGRLTHIHGKLKVGSVTKQTTNFFLPKAVEEEVYKTYSKGQNPITIEKDIELQGDVTAFNALLMDVKGDVANGYTATFTIGFE